MKVTKEKKKQRREAATCSEKQRLQEENATEKRKGESPGEATEEGNVCHEAGGEQKEEERKKKEKEAQESYMRLMAEFQNFKKRTEKEKDDIYAYAAENIIGKLLPVLDNFERALGHGSEDKKFLEGMNLIFHQFISVLQEAGLEEIPALGEIFDPACHNAVMAEENPDYESGAVSAVVQKGYRLKRRVIRPSMVKVNK